MDTSTGELMSYEEMKKRIKQEPQLSSQIKKIPQKFLPEIEGMNRKQRRAWYAKNKKRIEHERVIAGVSNAHS